MFNIIQNFAQLIRIPLSFFPAGVQAFFHFVIAFFVLHLSGKLLRWLWDLLPMI